MISTREDALKILGFDENANPSAQEIRGAYRKNALRTHPDKLVYPEGASDAQRAKLLAEQNAAFIAVGESYTLLSKPISQQPRRARTRRQYYPQQQTSQNRGYKRAHSNPQEEFTLEDAIALFNSLSPTGKMCVTAVGLVGVGLYLYSAYKEITTGKSLLDSILEPDDEPSEPSRAKRKKFS